MRCCQIGVALLVPRAVADVGCSAAPGDDAMVALQVAPRGASLRRAGAPLIRDAPRAKPSPLCLFSPGDEVELLQALQIHPDDDSASAWERHQVAKLGELEKERPSPLRQLRVLVASPVSSTGMLEGIAHNAQRLAANRAGDIFKFALFHYHLSEEQAPPSPDDALRPHVVYARTGRGCKAELWQHLTLDVVGGFDNLWLILGMLEGQTTGVSRERTNRGTHSGHAFGARQDPRLDRRSRGRRSTS